MNNEVSEALRESKPHLGVCATVLCLTFIEFVDIHVYYVMTVVIKSNI